MGPSGVAVLAYSLAARATELVVVLQVRTPTPGVGIGELVTVPNTLLTEQAITRPFANPRYRVEDLFGIEYRADLGTALALLEDTAESLSAIAEAPSPHAYVEEFDADVVAIEVHYWIENPGAAADYEWSRAAVQDTISLSSSVPRAHRDQWTPVGQAAYRLRTDDVRSQLTQRCKPTSPMPVVALSPSEQMQRSPVEVSPTESLAETSAKPATNRRTARQLHCRPRDYNNNAIQPRTLDRCSYRRRSNCRCRRRHDRRRATR